MLLKTVAYSHQTEPERLLWHFQSSAEQLAVTEPSHFTRNSSCPPSWVQREMAAIKAKHLFSQTMDRGCVTRLCKRLSDRFLGHNFNTLCE